MGRPLIIVCAITIVVLGVIQINLNDRQVALAERTSSYANEAEMINMAHAGAEFTLNRLRSDTDWRNGYAEYEVPLDYGTAYVLIEDKSIDASLADDQLRLKSRVPLQGEEVKVDYLVEVQTAQIPNIPGALALTDPNFTTMLGGSFYINGIDESGVDTEGLPGITVIDQASKDQIIDENKYQHLDQIDGNTSTGEDPSIVVDPTMDFAPLSELIEALAPSATRLSGGPYSTDDLGTESNPGVFMIEDYATIKGNTTGYGIMIVRENADLDVETTLDVAGTFDFHGLVLFENSWALDGQGNVTFHGTTVVGSTVENPPTTTIDLTGNITIQYNSQSLDFARSAAQKAIAANFNILDIYE
ncbi:hypothetical protein [Fodinibius salsisoli]|uniref:Type 4 fimbrial biogenesis protein PilX N-terminal domain-containing protein n=1 Tax=Fodinibius salsisoli TaxID=2820877 RepID=A0ABT3PLL0_9BACT|nr:hypothetical protein [Fodinibius salsisoli]MCW9706811.1 hypothetical protein [Fodinibius salsisoli]